MHRTLWQSSRTGMAVHSGATTACRPWAGARSALSTLPPGVFTRRGASPLGIVEDAVRAGSIREDPKQLAALKLLERLHRDMQAYEPLPLPPRPEPQKSEWRGPQFDKYGTPVAGGSMYTGVGASSANSGGFFTKITSLFGGGGGGGGGGGSGGGTDTAGEPCLDGVASPRGVYMHGGVGCGKSFLMDAFFECCDVDEEVKQRVHFNEFMLDVHKRMHEIRTKQALSPHAPL